MRAWLIVALLGLSGSAFAQQGAPSMINRGSADVSVGGHSAARQGDTTSNSGVIVQGSSNVFINGKPAATAGSRTDCGGVVASSGNGVFINGKPMAAQGDLASGCATK